MGSNKALIGHTGWASGASAVIKLLLALKHRVIPAHYGVNEINRKFGIGESCFEIPRTHAVWQPNIAGQPRRAAINGFGFGGTNAHLILEEFEPDYHNALVKEWAIQQTSDDHVVVIGESSIFPGEQGISSTITTKFAFDGASISLPRSKLVLPDITEHMARAQFLAVMAADQLIENVNAKGVDRSRIGIVFAFNDKCERACAANLHIYKERILRMIRGAVPDSSALEKLILDWYQRFESEHLPTGPYTLAGIMPNVITGRVANLYDLKGPNFVIGDSKGGIFSAVKIAQELIRAGNADLVLCGGMHLDPSPFGSDEPHQEGVVMFGLTSVNIAKQYDLPVLAELNVTDKEVEPRLNRVAV
jgi:3-oxoacyl-(acyl-carrier-protein) synthase